jgi:hypothetical protein
MKKRYSIMVREHGSDHDVELMQVESNPQAIVAGLHEKTLTAKSSMFRGGRTAKIPKYTFIQIIDNAKG